MPHHLKKLLALCLVPVLLLSGCGSAPQPEQPAQTLPAETAPPATTPPNGNPDDVTCLGTYTAGDDAGADTVIATLGDARLTNEQLWVYYWLEVAACRQESLAGGPDFGQPLDTQLVPLSSRTITWQQYFLEAALNTWAVQQALVAMSQTQGVPAEEAYNPDMERRAEYMTGMPATQHLYAWSEGYTPNRLHQAYLDALPDLLEELAAQGGYDSADSMAAAITGADSGALTHYAELSNRAYMYFTEMDYHFEPTQEEITAYYEAHQEELAGSGETTMRLRHILLRPNNGALAADGTVTATEEDWSSCLARADKLVADWQWTIRTTRYAQATLADVPESRFAELAKDYSADEGSRTNGGLYQGLCQGQLIPELDAWCFDASRQKGDYEIIRSDCGYHIVLFCGWEEDWYSAARAAMADQYRKTLMASALDANPLSVDYDAIRLSAADEGGNGLTPGDLLYPDVAHERFADMPLYLQQDYPEALYGNYKLSTHGCGITTMAMVASYLLDEELTPPELASRYGYYCGPQGTEQVLFDDTPAEMGFHLVKRSYDWPEVQQAIRDGHVVISLQWAGYWTRGGHYLAIIGENEEGKYVVRDSNLFNYKRVQAHQTDCHSPGSITAACHGYWIYEKKVTTISACVRCGDGNGVPEVLFQSGYHCAKCLTAMDRRNAFLTLVGN